MTMLIFDALLGATMLVAAYGALYGRNDFRAVVMFVVFGLLLALAWVRLDATDLALAEAAIGAGLTGALLLDTVGFLRSQPVKAGEAEVVRQQRLHSGTVSSVLSALASAGVAGALIFALVHDAPFRAGGLADTIVRETPRSGTSHPVTAVLLAFRAFDTMLEIAVLLAAGLVGVAVREPGRATALATGDRLAVSSPILDALVPRLIVAMILIGAYLLWAGSYMPGGAFQGGALLAACGVLLALTGPATLDMDEQFRIRLLLCIGFTVFLAVAWAGPLQGRAVLMLPAQSAGAIILLIEAMLTISIAAILYSLFVNAPSSPLTTSARGSQ